MPPPTPSPSAESLGRRLGEVLNVVGPLYRKATRSIEDQSGATGMSVGGRAVVELLAVTGAQPVPRMAEQLGLSRQFVQRSVDECVAASLVVLQDNPAHQRSRLVDLTPAGRSRLDRLHRDEQRVLAAAGAGLSQAEVDACLVVLRRLLTSVAWD